MNCVVCKNGQNKPGNVTVKFERNNSIILIKDVQAMVCSNCGHYYLEENIAKEVWKKADDAIRQGAVLEVMNMKAA